MLQKLLLVKKSAETTGDWTGNKWTDKITSVGTTKNKKKEDETNEIAKIYIPPEKRQQNFWCFNIILNRV